MTVPDQRPSPLPRAAIIEILERHRGKKYPYTGSGSVLCPNHLRINGVAMYATVDHPAVIKEVALDGNPGVPFAVRVQVFARALKVGGTPTFEVDVERGPESNSGAVIEIPDLSEFEAGSTMHRPYVLLNGHQLYVEDDIVIGELVTGGLKATMAVVTLTLLCRQLLVDDEPTGPAEVPDPAE